VRGSSPPEVGADFAWVAEGRRVASVRLSVTLPEGISENTRQKVLLSMLSCPARKMLAEPPNVEYTVIRQASSPLQFSRPQ
jgi:uncharacterized OsmC-like protein